MTNLLMSLRNMRFENSCQSKSRDDGRATMTSLFGHHLSLTLSHSACAIRLMELKLYKATVPDTVRLEPGALQCKL